MSEPFHIDEVSLIGTFDVHFTARELDERLGEWGLTIAPLPESSLDRTLGELIAAQCPVEASPRVGRFVDRVLGLSARLPDGRELTIHPAPRKAVGPDLLHAFIGARGATGTIVQATLRIDRRRPTVRFAFAHPSLVRAVAAACEILCTGARPVDLAVEGPCLIVTVDELGALAEAQAALAARVASDFGGTKVAPPSLPARPTMPFFFPVRLGDLAQVLSKEACTAVVGWHAFGAVCLDDQRPPNVASKSPDPVVSTLAEELRSSMRGAESR